MATIKTHGSVSCGHARKPVNHNVSILTGRKKTALHSSMAPSPKHTIFALYSCPPGRVGHTPNLIKFAMAICEIWAFKVSFVISSFFLMPYGGLWGL